ncbi:unnamed protein product [Caenorhabditis nigoni]
MVTVHIRLVGGKKEKKCDPVRVHAKSSLDELEKKIEELTGIPKKHQHVEHNGALVRESSMVSLVSFKTVKLNVKHAHVKLFAKYKSCVEKAKRRIDPHDNAIQAVKYYEQLQSGGIFKIYTEMKAFSDSYHANVAAWTDGNINLIRKATWEYFKERHDEKRGEEESDFECKFEKRDAVFGGRSANTIAKVRMHGESGVVTYNVKPHHNAPTLQTAGREPDIFELLQYPLLHKIGVCPKALIIPPTARAGTRTSTYIATVWDGDLQLLQDIRNRDLTAEIMVQLVMLRVLLFITDLHKQNCGRFGTTNNLAVIDFAPNKQYVVHDKIENAMWEICPHKRLKDQWQRLRDQHDRNSWLKIAKVYFEKWELAKNVEEARMDLEPIKEDLKGRDIRFLPREKMNSPTPQLEDYIAKLYRNIHNLKIVLESLPN